MLVLWAVACGGQDATVRAVDEPVQPVQQPPDDDGGDEGQAPDWNACPTGFLGTYYNLPVDHPDVEPAVFEAPDFDPDLVDWWDGGYQAFEQFDPSLEMGPNWWPVDDGFEGDPAYWAGRWNAWIRVNEELPVELVLGASTDVWVLIDGEVVARQHSDGVVEPETVVLDLPTGQFPLEVRLAHRTGDSGLRFRFASEHVAVCFAEYSDEE